MKDWGVSVLVIVLAAAPAAGDAVRLKSGLVYDPVSVTGVTEGAIRFLLSGRDTAKPLEDVSEIALAGDEPFNRAEELLKAGKHNEAAAAYAALLATTTVPWKKTLIRFRRLQAVDAAGAIDEAAKLWLELADDAGGVAWTAALRPTKLAPAKSPLNARAIALLSDKAKTNLPEAYRKAVLQVIVDLYEREGRLTEAQALQAELAGKTQPATGEVSPPDQPEPGAAADAELRLASLALKRSQYDQVVKMVGARLKTLRSADLPLALYLLGQAQLEQARGAADAERARVILLDAGLNLMRTVAFYPNSPEAPQALFSAGEVNRLLGNFTAAQAAYSAAITRYARSPAATRAKAALDELRGKQE